MTVAKEKTELINIEELKVEVVFKSGGMKPYIDQIKKASSQMIFTASTESGRKDIKDFQLKIMRSRKAIEKTANSFSKEIKEKVKVINGERDYSINQLLSLEAEIMKPVEEYNNIDKKRVEDLKERLLSLDINESFKLFDSDQLKNIIKVFEDTLIDDSWQEFKDLAKEKKFDGLETLNELLVTAEKKEADAIELEELRKNKAIQEQKEREAEIAKEATEKIAREKAEEADKANKEAEQAKAKAEADQKAILEKAEQEKKDALAKAEAEKEQALRDQQAKIDAESKAKADEEEKKRKAAEYTEYRRKINCKILEDFIKVTGISDEQSRTVLNAIYKGQIPNVSINY